MLEIVPFLLSIKECSKVEIVLFSAGTKLSGLYWAAIFKLWLYSSVVYVQ